MVLQRRFVAIFENFYCYFFLKFIKNERPCSCSYFSVSLLSEKVPVLELWIKMLLVYQIVGFFKGRYLMSKCEMKLTFCMHINIKVFNKFILLFLFRQPIKSQNSYRDKISQRMWCIALMSYTDKDLNQSC